MLQAQLCDFDPFLMACLAHDEWPSDEEEFLAALKERVHPIGKGVKALEAKNAAAVGGTPTKHPASTDEGSSGEALEEALEDTKAHAPPAAESETPTAHRSESEHMALVETLQDEHFAHDIIPPPEAAAWPEAELAAWFEAGGQHDEAVDFQAAPEVLIPFGENCAVATILQALDARSAAYPLDWVYSELPMLLRFLESDCAPEELLSGPANLRHVLPHNRTRPSMHAWELATGPNADQPTCEAAEAKKWPGAESNDGSSKVQDVASLNDGDGLQAGCHVQDRVTGAVFPHDFGPGPLEPQYDRVMAKYRRRCARLRAVLQSKTVVLLHVRNSYLSGARSPHPSDSLQRLDKTLRRWPRVRVEAWNLVEDPGDDVFHLGRVRHYTQPLFHDPDGHRERYIWLVLGLRLIELNAVGEEGQMAKVAVLQGAKQLLAARSAVP